MYDTLPWRNVNRTIDGFALQKSLHEVSESVALRALVDFTEPCGVCPLEFRQKYQAVGKTPKERDALAKFASNLDQCCKLVERFNVTKQTCPQYKPVRLPRFQDLISVTFAIWDMEKEHRQLLLELMDWRGMSTNIVAYNTFQNDPVRMSPGMHWCAEKNTVSVGWYLQTMSILVEELSKLSVMVDEARLVKNAFFALGRLESIPGLVYAQQGTIYAEPRRFHSCVTDVIYQLKPFYEAIKLHDLPCVTELRELRKLHQKLLECCEILDAAERPSEEEQLRLNQWIDAGDSLPALQIIELFASQERRLEALGRVIKATKNDVQEAMLDYKDCVLEIPHDFHAAEPPPRLIGHPTLFHKGPDSTNSRMGF